MSLESLYATILARKNQGAVGESYVASLFAKGGKKIAQKIGEEATEVVLARDEPAELIKESADLLFHLSVLWAYAGVTPAEVMAELTRREGTSGLDEKAARPGIRPLS